MIMMSPIALTNWCGTMTPFAEPRTLERNEFLVARTRQPWILVGVKSASSTSPK